ncbi:MAG: transporter substrate-binding domain-containing protein, partial [Alphaproteobacteria bacterium]|nr:transporter substrate-binding domain-containing protein [Alphaproteobacteria bacterium]
MRFRLASLLLSFAFVLSAFSAHADDARETAWQRIIRTNTIRCGYYVFPPVTYRDPNTKALSGFSVDMMEAIGKAAGLKIEWTEEVNFANWVPALQAGRFDMACTPMWPDIPLGRVVSFSVPFMFAGLSPMVRADDDRFKGDDLARLNQ